ncbi:hypothetical protein A3K72_00635 [Candidatus Woesearchaeota archaeon RBG_13_36_6]|nr:MAG: hypothetical protein A3K72_00635 [Candidatus Woesearchaeota archaeon RBG_13_36_6]
MSKDQKDYSERKHREVHRYLQQHFPDCEVKYNGLDGIDHTISFNGRTINLETKSCRRTIKSGRKSKPTSWVSEQMFTFGRIKFCNVSNSAYAKTQHQDLIDSNGWYIIIVENRIRGIPARTLNKRLGQGWIEKRLVWDKVLFLSRPDWLEYLKAQVYSGTLPPEL